MTKEVTSILPKVCIAINYHKAILDWQSLEDYHDYLSIFLDDYGLIKEELAKLISLHELDRACKLMHKLRGSASALLLNEVTSAAEVLEYELGIGKIDYYLIEELQRSVDEIRFLILNLKKYQNQYFNSKKTNDGRLPLLNINLLNELYCALDEHDPRRAESILQRLQGNIPESALISISLALKKFDFKTAMQYATSLM